jgi:predicted transcriptional regulator
MEIVDVLKTAGLDEKEAQVYLGLLELGTASVQLIASKAGLKRPTTYLILDSLQAKGMVSIIPRAKKSSLHGREPGKNNRGLTKYRKWLSGLCRICWRFIMQKLKSHKFSCLRAKRVC